MKLKKRTIHATDEKWEQIRRHAKSKKRSISNFLLLAADSEMSKHPHRESLEVIVESILEKKLSERFPTKGDGAEGNVCK